jgi:hypothetical protein
MRYPSLPPVLACLCAVVLAASACASEDAADPEPDLSSDAAASSAPIDAASQNGGTNATREAGAGNNVVWEDIGEDAMTIKEAGTVTLNGGSATNGEDKMFQINAESVFRVSNFTGSHAGKFIRQNGGTTYKVQVFIDRCNISYMDEAIFRTDSSTSTVSLTNTRYSQIGESLFMGVTAANITESGNTQY